MSASPVHSEPCTICNCLCHFKAQSMTSFHEDSLPREKRTMEDAPCCLCKDQANIEIVEMNIKEEVMDEDENNTDKRAAINKPVAKLGLSIDTNHKITHKEFCPILQNMKYQMKYLRCRECDKSFRFARLRHWSLLHHLSKNHKSAPTKIGLNKSVKAYGYPAMLFDASKDCRA